MSFPPILGGRSPPQNLKAGGEPVFGIFEMGGRFLDWGGNFRGCSPPKWGGSATMLNRKICKRSGVSILAVNYRKAPEYLQFHYFRGKR